MQTRNKSCSLFRVKALTQDIPLIVDAVKGSEIVELVDGVKVSWSGFIG